MEKEIFEKMRRRKHFNLFDDKGPENLFRKNYQKQFYKTSICESIKLTGTCARGNLCTYAHDESELARLPDLSKTSYCVEYQKTGMCEKGEKCGFAHTADELNVSTDVFYKTKPCTFNKKGRCESGMYCRFKHFENKKNKGLPKTKLLKEERSDHEHSTQTGESTTTRDTRYDRKISSPRIEKRNIRSLDIYVNDDEYFHYNPEREINRSHMSFNNRQKSFTSAIHSSPRIEKRNIRSIDDIIITNDDDEYFHYDPERETDRSTTLITNNNDDDEYFHHDPEKETNRLQMSYHDKKRKSITSSEGLSEMSTVCGRKDSILSIASKQSVPLFIKPIHYDPYNFKPSIQQSNEDRIQGYKDINKNPATTKGDLFRVSPNTIDTFKLEQPLFSRSTLMDLIDTV